MALEFSTTDTPAEDVGVKICVHGPSGYGKTVLAATLPGEALIISAEAGLLSIAPANLIRMFGVSRNLPVIVIRSGADFIESYNFVATNPQAKKFTAIGVDSISEIADMILAHELKLAKDPRQAYGTTNQIMAEYIRKFRDLKGKHVYFSARQEKSADTDGITRFAPVMPGKTLTQLAPHFFDEVFALCLAPKDAQGNSRRFLRTKPDIQYQAKDRSGALLSEEEPNLAQIIAKIQKR